MKNNVTPINPKAGTAILAFIIIFSLFSCSPRVEPLGVFGKSRLAEVLGQDGVTPIPFDEHTTFWTFGDTMLGAWKGGVSASATFLASADIKEMLSNSLAFTDAPAPKTVANLKFTYYKENGKIAQFVKLRAGENPMRDRLWAVDGIRLGDRLYVYYMVIKIDQPGKPFAFSLRGTGIARWEIPEKWKPGDEMRFMRLPNLFPGGYPAFGACAIERNGYVYTIGQYTTKQMTSPVKIARVIKNEIENSAHYEFLGAGGAWVRDAQNAEPLLNDVAGECSLSYNEYLKCYILVYCQLWTGNIIMVKFRDFSEIYSAAKEVIYQPPKLEPGGAAPNVFYYSGKEIFSHGGDIYAIYINPLEYQPYCIKIKL